MKASNSLGYTGPKAAAALAIAATLCIGTTLLCQPAHAFADMSLTAKTTSNTATVQWGKVKAATKYQVRYKKVAAKNWKIKKVSSGKTSAKLSSLAPLTKYKLQVKALKGKKVIDKTAVKTITTKAFGFSSEAPSTGSLKVIRDTKFNGIYADMTIEDFNELGFTYGDSVNATFSNGFTLEDIPYFDGYYVKDSQWLLVGYPGYPHIKLAMNNNGTTWETAGVDEDSTVTITLNERGKYLSQQEAFSQKYSDERTAYTFDTEFANARSLKGGSLKSNLLYRSASPCDNQHNRAPYVDRLIQLAGVRYILNLADTSEEIEEYMQADGFDSPYFYKLYTSNKILFTDFSTKSGKLQGDGTFSDGAAALNMDMDFRSSNNAQKVAEGMRGILTNDGPYLIHCTEGKDRTGFVCALVEALAGASYDEMMTDYMITYDNYYGISKEKTPEKYQAIVDLRFDSFVQILCGDDVTPSAVTREQMAAGARAYLAFGGMTQDEIDQLISKICN